eukprot:12799431-Alexandrium_andersonii.AAC.1
MAAGEEAHFADGLQEAAQPDASGAMPGPSVAVGHSVLRVLYLFAGPQRGGDIQDSLQKLCQGAPV